MPKINPHHRNSVLFKTYLFLGGYAVFLISTIFAGVYYIAGNLKAINQSVIEFDELIQEVETVDDYFARQAKDRKNLFLRGHQEKDLEKYLDLINAMTGKINTKVEEIRQNPLAKPYKSELKSFIEGHNQLIDIYSQGVEIFQQTNDHTAGDHFVKGEGNEVGQELTQVIRQIRSDRQQLLKDNQRDTRNFLLISTGGLLLIILGCSAVLIVVITDPIRRIGRFTSFLEESSQGNQNINDNREISAANFDRVYLPIEGRKDDEIGYMIDTYTKLSNLIFEYSQTLEKRVETRTLELQRAKELAEVANKAKSSFLANMSHELRTPLNAILGFAQIMQRDAVTPSQAKNLAIINRSGEHLLALINEVLDLSKIEAGKTELNPHDFDLHCLLNTTQEILKLKAQNKGFPLLLDIHPDTPQYIHTDESKLRQILTNLLNNALKFTTQGSVSFRVRPDVNNNCRLILAVEDTGAGIADRELDSLFEAFTQTETGRQSGEGTGLGLPISLKFVQLMGGDMKVSSQVGVGTTFQFDVLVQPAQKELLKQQSQVIGLAAEQPVYRILVADDDPNNRQLVRQLLEPLGFEIEEAVNGKEAIALWQQWQPQLIFMDLQMPVMNGYEAIEQIKSQSPDVIAIALTADILENRPSLMLNSGCDDVISKPFRASELLTKLEEHLQVRFLYQESILEQNPITEAKTAELTPEQLEIMTAQWLENIHQAAVMADYEAIQELISQIEGEYAEIATELDNWLQEFRIDKIIELVEETSLQQQIDPQTANVGDGLDEGAYQSRISSL